MDTNRDQAIVKLLVDIADNLVDDFDIVELLSELTERCVNLLGVSAALMLASPEELRLVASSSEAMHVVELFELQANEGPCLDAFRTGEQVGHESLRSGSGPWPQILKGGRCGRVPIGVHAPSSLPRDDHRRPESLQ